MACVDGHEVNDLSDSRFLLCLPAHSQSFTVNGCHQGRLHAQLHVGLRPPHDVANNGGQDSREEDGDTVEDASP